MTTLVKRRRNRLSPLSNQILTPWSNTFMAPFNDRFFSTPFEEMKSLLRFDDVFKDDFFDEEGQMPAMNIKEHENDFEIEFAAPGFDKKDFEVSIEDDVLHVCGEKKVEKEEKDEDFSRKEFSYKSFKRSSLLPETVDLNQKIKANYKNGILKVNLLKKPEAVKKQPPKKIIEVV